MTEKVSVKSISLHKPETGQTLQVSITPGSRYSLDFDTSTVLFEQQNGELRLYFEDGAAMRLSHFTAAIEKADISFSLPDGAEVSGRDIVETLHIVLQDFKTHTPEADGTGETVSNDLTAASAVLTDHLEATAEEGSAIAPVRHTVCDLPPLPGNALIVSEEQEHPLSDAYSAPLYFIPPSGSILLTGYDASRLGEQQAHPGSPAPGHTAMEVLLLEDLLDTSLPQMFCSEYASPTFESFLSSSLPDAFLARTVPVSESDSLVFVELTGNGEGGRDELLMAFLQMSAL